MSDLVHFHLPTELKFLTVKYQDIKNEMKLKCMQWKSCGYCMWAYAGRTFHELSV